MKRALNWTFNLICLLSLLFSAAVSVVWIRSYWVGDYWVWYDQEPFASNILRFGHGYIQYSWYDVSRMTGLNIAPGHYSYDSLNDSHFTNVQIGQTHYAFAGLRFDQSKGNYSGYRLVQAHLAWPVLLTSSPPALWVVHWRRRRHRKWPGLCHVCGYDLRASPGRCPECGTSSATGNSMADSSLSAAIADIMSQRKL